MDVRFLSAPASPRVARRPAAQRTAPAAAPGRRGRELLGQHRRAARRRPRAGDEHHRQPRHRPARLRADRVATRARWPARSSRSSTASATTPGPPSCSPPTRSAARPSLDVGDVLGAAGRRQPAPVVLARLRRGRSIDAITADYAKLDPADAAYFDRAEAHVRDRRRSRRYNALRARDPRAASPACPSATARASSQPLGASLGLRLAHPAGFAKAIAEGTDVERRRQGRPSSASSTDARSRCGSTTARTRRPTCSSSTRSRERAAHPDRDRHRDALARDAAASSSGRPRSSSACIAALHEATGR